MEKTINHIQSFDQIPALKNAINNLSSELLNPTTAPTILISIASKIYQLFAPLRTVTNFSGENSDEILFVDKPNLLESSLQLLLREIRGHFQLAGEPTLSIPSMSLRINPALSCVPELTPLHLLVLHQQSSQEPLLLVVEDEQQTFDERWTALLQHCKVDHASVSALVDSSVRDVVTNTAVASTDQQATAEEDDEEVDLDIDSPPTSVREETTVQTTTIISDAEIHNEVLVSTTIESHEVSTKLDEQLAIETKSAAIQEPVDEELDDVDVADVSASVTNNSGDETHVGQKRHREEQEEAIIDGEPEPKRPKLDVETTTIVTTVTETTVDMIQVE